MQFAERQLPTALTLERSVSVNNTYYVYQLVDPRSGRPFYVGKGTGQRAYSHLRFKDGNGNPYKDRTIQQIFAAGQIPVIEFLHQGIKDENLAYQLEEHAISSIGIDNLTNLVSSCRPPSRKGWKPSKVTLEKRGRSLRGIPRSAQWLKKLSESKQGTRNPMYGKKNPCSEETRISIARTKNLAHYDTYKKALDMMSQGLSADTVAQELGIGRGICFRLKNGTHGIFTSFPELKQSKAG